jgi:hypothetical protein
MLVRPLVRPLVGPSVGPSVGPLVPISLRKLVTSRLLREEEKEEENWLRRNCFAPGNGCPFLLSDLFQNAVISKRLELEGRGWSHFLRNFQEIPFCIILKIESQRASYDPNKAVGI